MAPTTNLGKAKELNDFFCRPETRDFSKELQAALDLLWTLQESSFIGMLWRFFSHICTRWNLWAPVKNHTARSWQKPVAPSVRSQ